MTREFKYILANLAMAFLICCESIGQVSKDTIPCLVRFEKDKTLAYKIPLTKYCLVKDAGIVENQEWPVGWVMKWDVVRKSKSNLLFLEMNSSDVTGWDGKGSIGGSVQLIFELPSFSHTISMKGLKYNTKGLYLVNNYPGISAKKEHVDGEIKLTTSSDGTFVNSFIELLTEHPNTKQYFRFNNKPIPTLTFEQYQELENRIDSARENRKKLMVEAITASVSTRDSIWSIKDQRVRDSLKLHPYSGKFRFWVSDIDKASYSRSTYCFTSDSILIKRGPYDFIYLAKNYSKDSVYFRKALNQIEKEQLSTIERRIELDSLKESYRNFCIMDGLILSFSFESARFSKDVTVSNYYNETIAIVIDLVNKISPKEYRIWYDKKSLLKLQDECNGK